MNCRHVTACWAHARCPKLSAAAAPGCRARGRWMRCQRPREPVWLVLLVGCGDSVRHRARMAQRRLIRHERARVPRWVRRRGAHVRRVPLPVHGYQWIITSARDGICAAQRGRLVWDGVARYRDEPWRRVRVALACPLRVLGVSGCATCVRLLDGLSLHMCVCVCVRCGVCVCALVVHVAAMRHMGARRHGTGAAGAATRRPTARSCRT